jgi:hypothetical protein
MFRKKPLLFPIFERISAMIIDQTLRRVTGDLKRFLHIADRRMRLPFLIPALLILAVTACSPVAAATIQPPNATSAPVGAVSANAPAATQPPANNPVLPQDPRAAVEYALRTQPKSLPFKVTTTFDSGGTQMVSSALLESPTRIMLEDGTHSVISADGQCYEKTGAGAWGACAAPATGQTALANANSLLDQATIEAAIAIIKTVTLSGTDTLNGINAQIYDYASSGTLMGMQVDSSAKMWVNEKTGLPIKVVTTSTVGSATSTFTQLITYDSTLKVVTP